MAVIRQRGKRRYWVTVGAANPLNVSAQMLRCQGEQLQHCGDSQFDQWDMDSAINLFKSCRKINPSSRCFHFCLCCLISVSGIHNGFQIGNVGESGGGMEKKWKEHKEVIGFREGSQHNCLVALCKIVWHKRAVLCLLIFWKVESATVAFDFNEFAHFDSK